MELPITFSPGFGVFETLRVENGTAFFVEEHWRSLLESAKTLGLYPKKDFRNESLHLPKEASGKWRWIVGPREEKEFFEPLPVETKEGFSLEISEVRVGSRNWDSRLKTLSYLSHFQARLSVNADEAMLLNEQGQVVSGAMSNIFFVKKDKVFTPSLQTGCRNGVIRQWVMSQIEVAEEHFGPETLQAADEIFLTNSWIGIKPVVRFESKILKKGKITTELEGLLANAYSLFKKLSSESGIRSQSFNQGREELSDGAR
ncbi:aminotransferase class IV [Methylacidiphilum kamchatkense]|uniref:branched-chain-amino-acid transaminase n=1 Tax=Methylacidiphilum kamchatkense Kam1 TaxID=1202785 RepID=A0A516TNC9_9BACT|nr:aminotransferase class IV [Methylacidiphilum kamchatkense]QDQ42741.1 4-amino-4-deoxychorismate lyase [Methylacidiphilum kamchatkense Kam1]